jgi:hypothetical protein
MGVDSNTVERAILMHLPVARPEPDPEPSTYDNAP